MKLYGLKESDILRQVNSEYLTSTSSLNAKRQLLQERLRLYNEQAKNDSKLTIKIIYSQIRTLLALGYSDKSIVEFGAGSFDDMTNVSMWNKVQEFDYDEMGLDVISYVNIRDKLFYGVGIRCFDGWDEEKKVPIISDRNPLSWLPDPKGWLKSDNFRRHGFESKITKREAQQQGYEKIRMLSDTSIRQFGEQNYYDLVYQSIDNTPNADYNVYHHFTQIKGEWFLATTSGQCSTLHRFVKVSDWMGRSEAPLSLFYYSPERLDPYGTSLTDLSEDSQRSISELLNLAIAWAKRSALGSHIAYDSSMINENDVADLSIEPKLIPVDTGSGQKPIQNAIFELPRTQVPQDNQITTQRIEYFNKIATGLDTNQMGVSAQGAMTATETQQLQANANIIYSLTNSINFWGEKDFWAKYLHMYRENFSGKKFIKIKGAFGPQFFDVNKKDLNTKMDPDITIVSSNEKKAKDKELLVNIAPFVPEILKRGGFSADYTLRKVLQLAGVDEDEAKAMVLLSTDERQAYRDLELINRNENLVSDPDIMNEDHDVYITIYSQANDTPAKMVEITKRVMAKIEQDKIMKQQQQAQPNASQGNNAMQNVTQAQATNNLLQSNKGVVSAQDVQA